MSLNNNKEILKKIKNGLSSDDLQAGNGVTITKDEESGILTINSDGSGGSSTIEASDINGNIVNNDKELKVYDDTDVMKISTFVSETDSTSVKKAKKLEGEETLQPLMYRGSNSQGEVGYHYFPFNSNGQASIDKRTILNAKANQEYILESDKDLNCGAIVQCWKTIEETQDTQGILNTFTNNDSEKYYYNNENIDFQDNTSIKMKNKYDLSFTENDGLYTSSEINKDDYINGIEVVYNG